jgi:hypothetical protein
MKTITFKVELTVEEDSNSYHGTKIDAEKFLVQMLGDMPRVVVYKVTDEYGESYYDQRGGVFFGKAAERAIQAEVAHDNLTREKE